MGYIKKLKNNELVGGTDKTTIYPVTSTEAVFEEITNGNESSFKSQKTINKEQQDELDNHEERIQAAEAEDIKSITINGSTKKFEVDDENNVDLTIYTVDSDPDMPGIADNVRDLRNMVGTSTPVLETSHKTRIETLEGGESVTGSVENKIKTKIDSINSSYQDDDNEYVKYSMTQTSGEVTDFNIDETNLKNAIASLNTSISGDNIVIRSGSTPSGTGEAGKIYRYVNSSNNTYTDYMYSGGSWVTLATHDTSNEQAQVAYYTCIATGSGAQAIKQFVGNGSLTYNPSSGGHIKILMGEANTATGTIYLKFGTTSATDSTKKPLYYNGEPASANNTWEAGETIAVYYDPSANNNTGAYFASNAQGGGGKAEKIKYDNSTSGLAAENVQGAIDETASGVSELMNVFSGGLLERFTLTGNNRTAVEKRFDNLTAGKTYRLTVDLDTFDYSSSTLNGYNIFSAAYVVGSQETLYFKTMKGTDTVVAVHEFVAVDADYTYVLIRANAGCVVQFKIEEIGTVTSIDEEPTKGSNNLVRSGGVYNSINNLVNTLASIKFILIGNGNTAVDYKFYPQAGSHCTLIVDLATFIHTNVTSGYNIFSVFYMPRTSSTSVMVFRTMKGTDALVAKHEFDAVDAEYYVITIRANVGQEVDFSLTTVGEDGYIPIDDEPTKGSNNLVRSGGVYDMFGKTDIVSLNDENRTVRYLRNLRRPNYSQDLSYTPGLTPFTLLHFSDLHSDKVNLRRLLEYKEHYASYIDDAILTGDNIRDKFGDSFAFWENLGAEDILLSTGNHEYWNGSNYTTITPLQVYDKFFAPYYENWGDTVVFPANADTEGYNYYYKDYPTRNIRLFVLDSMANMNSNRNGVQAAWLATELENARVAGRHVICAIHIGSTFETPFNNPFTSYVVIFDAEESGVNAPTYAEFYTLRDAVETFIDNGGKFVAWIGGHRHKDSIAVLYKKVNNENVPLQQTSIHVATCSGGEFSGDAGGHGRSDSNNDGHSWWIVPKGDDCDRTDGTRQQDCFNIYSVDTEKQLLRIFRVGSDVDRNGRHKGSLVYDYANRQVLYYD